MRELLLEATDSCTKIPRNLHFSNELISKIISNSPGKISIELSPNRQFQAELINEIKPSFVSITWLGNEYDGLPIGQIPAVVLAREFCQSGFSVLLHVACRNIGKERMREVLDYVASVGVRNILALQGDPHQVQQNNIKCDFPYASNFVTFIKQNYGNKFCIGVAGYPNLHPQSTTEQEDLHYLKEKVSQGADFILTQANFNYKCLHKFAKKCRQSGITLPILPGIYVIKSHEGLLKMAEWCNLDIPENILDFVQRHKDDKEAVESYGLELARKLIRECLDGGEFAGVHVFSMNDMEGVMKLLINNINIL